MEDGRQVLHSNWYLSYGLRSLVNFSETKVNLDSQPVRPHTVDL